MNNLTFLSCILWMMPISFQSCASQPSSLKLNNENDSTIRIVDNNGGYATGKLINNRRFGVWKFYKSEKNNNPYKVVYYRDNVAFRNLDSSDYVLKEIALEEGRSVLIPESWKKVSDKNIEWGYKKESDTSSVFAPNFVISKDILPETVSFNSYVTKSVDAFLKQYNNGKILTEDISSNKAIIVANFSYKDIDLGTTIGIYKNNRDLLIFNCTSHNTNGDYVYMNDLFVTIINSYN